MIRSGLKKTLNKDKYNKRDRLSESEIRIDPALPPWSRKAWTPDELKSTWPYLTASQVLLLKDAFGMFDTDGKGWFVRDELMEVMVELSGGNKPAADDVDVVFAELDCNADGRVDFCEFLAKFMTFGDASELQQVLKLLSVAEHENGWLTIQSLISIFQIIGEPLPDSDLAYLTRLFNEGTNKGSSNGKVALVDLLALLDKEEQEALNEGQDDDNSRALGVAPTTDATTIAAHYNEDPRMASPSDAQE